MFVPRHARLRTVRHLGASLATSLIGFALLVTAFLAAPSSDSPHATQPRLTPMAMSSMSNDELADRAEWNSDYARYLGHRMLKDKGFHRKRQWRSLRKLWNHESSWRVHADNSYSSAYGIPQALPGHKMASKGRDWRTNPRTQIAWGLGYIKKRYGSPCGAWAHFRSHGWY
jgi:hypothetical protein